MAIFVPRFVRQLRDVLLTAPADGEVLTYDSADEKWKNAAGGGGGGDLTDAVILAPASSARNRIVSTAEGVAPLTLETLDPGANFEWVLRLVGPGGEIGGFDSAGGLSLIFYDPDAAFIFQGLDTMLGPIFQCGVPAAVRYSGFDAKSRFYTGNNLPVADGDVAGDSYVHLWFDSTDGAAKLMWKGKTADGTVVNWEFANGVYAPGGGGAPTTATYITQTPDAGLSAEQALSALATGLVKNTTGTGVLSIGAQGTDYYAPGGTDVALADGGTGASTAAGARTNLGAAVDSAPYITTAADAGLSAEVVLGTDVIMSGTLGARPAASIAGRLYFATDVNGGTLYRDTGAAWVQVGTGQNGRMPPALVCWTGHPGPALAGGVGALNTANRAQGHRVIVPKTGTLVDVHVYIPTSSGNIEVGILDTTATTRNRLWTTGSIASPGTGWQDMGDPNLSVTEGDQLDFYVNADNTTVTFDRILSAAVLGHVVLPAAFFPAAGGGKPTVIWQGPAATFPLASTLAEASMGGFAIAPCVIARVS